MPEDLPRDIGETLCAACAAGTRDGQADTCALAQEALKIAGEEVGSLPHLDICPNGGAGKPGCPLLQSKV